MVRPYETTATTDQGAENLLSREPPLLTKLTYASYVYFIKGLVSPVYRWINLRESFNPPPGAPDIVKTYECRPNLPVRIFLPTFYDQTSPQTLPTLFTIHGGGFCVGQSRDDDEWNRSFADSQYVLVVALNYSKAPENPFPTSVHDIGALLNAVLSDESLPIDRTPNTASKRSRTAILGFSSGANLALAACQLPLVREQQCYPAAVISCYGNLDLTVPVEEKTANRPWKGDLLPPPRNATTEPTMTFAPALQWGYIPYGQDLSDPLLSPYFAPRERLPPFVGVVAAELDILAHESWRFACRLAKEGAAATVKLRQIPDRKSNDPRWRICGWENSVGRVGELEKEEVERFAFEDNWGTGGVKWLLVPDVMHGFDNANCRWWFGGQETIEDAESKAEVCGVELGRWLKETVWCLDPGDETASVYSCGGHV
ncbi:Alpha/Beta hydrolase protein [Rhypophila decipiens]